MINQVFIKMFNSRIGLKWVCAAFLSFILMLSVVKVSAAQDTGKNNPTELEKKREMIKKAKDDFNNTIWEIEIRKTGVGKKQKKAKIEKDILRFQNYKFVSDKLALSDFTPTNYTVRLKRKDNDIVIWETMQTSEKEGIAFWRGEIKNDVMRGVLSWHINKKTIEDYAFTSVKKEVIAGAELPKKAVVKEPETKVVPEAVKEPETKVVPEAVKEPETKVVPETVKEPESKAIPEEVKEPVKEKTVEPKTE